MSIAIALTALTALGCKLPFLRFPMDEDFAFYTYLSHFRKSGIRMKEDFFVIFPAWRTRLISLLYANGYGEGVVRIRLFYAIMHVATSLVVLWAAFTLTGSVWAATVAGLLYAVFGTVPALSCHTLNMDQIYLPFTLAGMVMSLEGQYGLAGLLMGTAALAKIQAGIYVPPLALLLWHRADFSAALTFAAISAAPCALSIAADLLAGYGDAVSRRQVTVRAMVGLRLGRLKRMYGSIAGDIKAIVHETLPVWVIGFPAVLFTPYHKEGVTLTLFILITLAMIVFQKAFSRYHYLPTVALLCIATAVGLSNASQWKAGLMAGLAAATLITIRHLWPFYRRPLHPKTLAHYDKFDQYLYLPRLGKTLGRLMRMRKEEGRIFVWGNFAQLYHYSGHPASDAFVHYAIGPWDDERLAGYFDTIIGGFVRHRPQYVVKTFPNLDMALVNRITGLEYRLLKVCRGRFPVYRLAGAHAPAQDPLALDASKKLELMEQLTRGRHVPGVMEEPGYPLRNAIRECQRLVRLNCLDTEGLFHLGRLYEQAGVENGGMKRMLQQLVKEKPGQRLARLALAREYMKEKNFASAALLVADEERLFGPTNDTLFYRGLVRKQMGQPENAADDFSRLRRLDPRNGEYALYHAECLSAVGRNAEAREAFDAAWRSGGKTEWIRTRAALGIAALDAPEKKEHETLAEFIGRDATNPSLAYACASALERDGRHDAAREAFAAIARGEVPDDIKGAAFFRLARLSANGVRHTLAAECLRLLPRHRGAKEMVNRG